MRRPGPDPRPAFSARQCEGRQVPDHARDDEWRGNVPVPRHSELDPGAAFFSPRHNETGGSRIKPGMTDAFGLAVVLSGCCCDGVRHSSEEGIWSA
jgi:hypothetical protein